MSSGPFAPVSGNQPVGTESRQEPPQDSVTTQMSVSPGKRNWMGYVALPASALGLSLVGIVLGHLGLNAVKNGQANNRPFAFAGMVVGYVALAATIAAAVLWVTGPRAQVTADAQAEADTTSIGSAIAEQMVEGDALPGVTRSGDEYTVGAHTVEAQFPGDTTVTVTGAPLVNWCVELTFDGGSVDGYSYTPSEGTEEGLSCG